MEYEMVPSTAANPGADHMVFWDTVRPVDDPFWSQHKPGDRWGCQCSLEATDDPETPVPETVFQDPDAGLDNNPADNGRLFSDSHPYFPSSCSTCPFNTGSTTSGPTNKARDCANCSLLKQCISSYIEQKSPDVSKLAQKLSDDSSYKDVKFNPETGALSARHISHKEDNGRDAKVYSDLSGKEFSGKQLEFECQKCIYAMGKMCILEAESTRIDGKYTQCLDATIMGERMDIASITRNNKSTYFNSICRKEEQLMGFNKTFGANAHCLALYFHDTELFNATNVKDSLQRYQKHIRYHGAIDTIYCIVSGLNDIVVIK